jgi:AraC family transcriptional regulator
MHQQMYAESIHKVIDYINSGLEQDLSLDKLASVASFSPFHFQRMFKAFVKESPQDFITRLRLERAATLLSFQRNLSITEIGFRCGFSSSASFARAFKSKYGICATDFRKTPELYKKNDHRKICKESGPKTFYPDSSSIETDYEQRKGSNTFKVVVKQIPTFHVAYVRLLSGFDKGVYNPAFTAAFDKVIEWAVSNKVATEPFTTIGIAFDHPDITQLSKCRYDTGVTVQGAVSKAEAEIGIQDIKEGIYASVQIEADNPDSNGFAIAISLLGEAVDYLYANWLPQSEYVLCDQPALDIYHTSSLADPVVVEYCLPVSKYYE